MKQFKRLNRRRKMRTFRVANAVKRYSTRPRLCVFRSNKHLTAQIIDDELGKTIVSAGTNDKSLRTEIPFGGNVAAATKIGEVIAKLAIAANVTKVVFDRHGYKYHGRVKELADSARRAGLDIGPMQSAEEIEAKKAAKAAKNAVKGGAKSSSQKKADKEAGKNRAPVKKK